MRHLTTIQCEGCGIPFATYEKTMRYHSRSCAAKAHARANPEARAEQLRIAREARKPRPPKPDLSVFDVPVFRAPPPPAVEEPAELPAIPLIDYASRVMLGWAGARL